MSCSWTPSEPWHDSRYDRAVFAAWLREEMEKAAHPMAGRSDEEILAWWYEQERRLVAAMEDTAQAMRETARAFRDATSALDQFALVLEIEALTDPRLEKELAGDVMLDEAESHSWDEVDASKLIPAPENQKTVQEDRADEEA